MATVFALVLLPLIFCVGMMALIVGADASFWSYVAFGMFGLIASGMFVGLFNLARKWEDEPV